MGRALARVTRRRRLVVAVGLPALLLAAGLVWGMTAAMGASPSPSASGSPLIARFGTTFDADNLNPFIGYSGTSYEIFHLNYDLLVGYAPRHRRRAPSWLRAGRPRRTARSGPSTCARA